MRDFTQYEGPMVSWPKIEVINDVDTVLRKLYGKYTLCVASNAGESDTPLMRKALERGDIDKYFTFHFTSKDLGYSKPDPMFFEEILSRLGFVASEALMIGNDYQKDIIGAKQVGIRTVLFNEAGIEDDFCNADIIIRNLIELPRILEILNLK